MIFFVNLRIFFEVRKASLGIFFNNSGITGLPKKVFDIAAAVVEGNKAQSRNTEIDSLDSSITKLENEISNVSNKMKRKGIFGSRAELDYEGEMIRSNALFNRGKQVDEIKNKLSDKLSRLKDRKKELENQKIETGVSKIVTQDLKKENVKTEKDHFYFRNLRLFYRNFWIFLLLGP